MDFTASVVVGAPLDDVRAAVSDLTTYPRWFTIVRSVVADGDGWLVDLGAKVGPFTRTKRVRMVRAGELRFERDEADGGVHAAWTLQGTLSTAADGAWLQMDLHYGGVPWIPGLDLLLRNEAAGAGGRLDALLAQPPS